MNGDGSRPPLRILLVDDHALVRSAVRQAISGPDLEVVGEAATGEEALAVAPRLRPDVVLLDIDMPGMTGLQVLRELAPRLPDTKFVMLSVSASERNVMEALRHGASGFLTKDLHPDALQRALRGIRSGDLPMSRHLAAQMLKRLAEGGRRAADPTDDPIAAAGMSEREEEVLRLLADGLTDREIATVLTISPRTVETHVSRILGKLGVRNRAEAARRYRERA